MGGQAKSFLFMLLAVAVPLTSDAAIYRCTDKDGRAAYTDTPCAPQEKMQEMHPVEHRPDAGQTGVSVGESPATSNGITDSTRHVQQILNARVAVTLAPLVQQCVSDRYNAWIRLQHPFPEKDAIEVKIKALNEECRRAMHVPETEQAANPPKVPTAIPSLQAKAPATTALSQSSIPAAGRSIYVQTPVVQTKQQKAKQIQGLFSGTAQVTHKD